MNFKAIVVIVLFLFVSVVVASDYQENIGGEDVINLKQKIANIDVLKESAEDRKKRLDNICENLIENSFVYPIGVGPHVIAGKKTEWCVNNFVRVDGWQLSGKSKIFLDDDFNIRRVKVGLINPEIYGDKIIRMHEDDVSRDEFIKWKEMHMSTTFGFSISWRF